MRVMLRRWRLPMTSLALLLAVSAAPLRAEDAPATPAAPTEAAADETPAGQSAAPREESLFTSQEMISRRYKRFEDTLYKIAEALRKTDPDRADLLLRAIGKSKEDRIGAQMVELVQLLRDNRQLGDAIDRQGDVVSQLHALLDLLLSEDRAKELQEEQRRIKEYLKKLNEIIAKEKGNRADNERGAPADDVAAQQKKIAEQTGKLGKKIEQDDQSKQGRPAKSGSEEGEQGQPGQGESPEDQPGDRDVPPKDADSGSQKPRKGKGKEPGEGQPGDPQPGEPKPGEPQPGDPQPGESQPQEGQPGEGEPQPGQPGEGQPPEGAPSESPPGEGQPGESQPSDSPPGDKQPSSQQTPGRDELERARRAMERAIDKLKKSQRHEASDEQDEALSNLQKAKEKLEEILRQLREEEKERFLAMLEARFQRMLAMQLLVYDGTLKLARTPEADRSARHGSRALQLARQEDEIAVEASKAILLLHEEGTAVAFPEAVEQVRDDMKIVSARLERVDVGELTQGIEREIIEALEEMIEALQKEMEKNKDKKEQQQQQQDGQQQDPALVDQLAELKMLRTLQLRVNHRTRRLGQLVEGEQALESDIVNQLQNLADRQARIQRATHDIATDKNK